MSVDPPVVERATAAFRGRVGEPAVRALAPGRVNLVGGHVDYSDGIVLPAAVDSGTVAVARPRDDDRIEVRSTTVDGTAAFAVGDDTDGWAAYVAGTAAVLAGECDAALGVDLLVDGDLPMGAGLSSSASLELAVAGALDAAHGLGLAPERLADVCWRAENEEVGMACGVMDQLAGALGEAGHALRLDCRSRDVEPIPLGPDDARLLVVDTNVEHALIDTGFNDRVRECHAATARFDELLGRRVRALRDVTPEEVEAHADQLDPVLTRRARHVTAEIRRVEAAVDALRTGDVATLGSLMTQSHRSLRRDYEVSCAELDAAVGALADREQVFGARMVGGGWGGSVVALLDPDAATDALARDVREEYAAAPDAEADTYAFVAGDGLSVERC
jgi:galactokinase